MSEYPLQSCCPQDREGEVIDIMLTLFDQGVAERNYRRSVVRKAAAKFRRLWS